MANSCGKPHGDHRLIGLLALVLFLLPAAGFAQDAGAPARKPASIFTEIKTQFKKDIQTVRDVARKERKKSARRTRKESQACRGAISEMKEGPSIGRPGPMLSDH